MQRTENPTISGSNPSCTTMEINCLNCGISVSDPEKKKFCSRSCSNTYNNRRRTSKCGSCIMCDKSLRGKMSIRLYCSRACNSEHKRVERLKKIESGEVMSDRILKTYLIDIHGEKCMKCGWNSINPTTGKVPIELEHSDGNSLNNKLENLKLLCPNCHSLTPTFRALNKGNGGKNRKR